MKPYEIKSQMVGKRAFEVASVGNLSVLLIGPVGSSKTTLREAFPTVESAERETCWCGHFRDATQGCVCSPQAIKRWYRRFERTARNFDIVLECCRVSAKELMSQRKPDIQEQGWMDTRIAEAKRFGETHMALDLSDDSAMRTMEMASHRLALTPGQFNRVLKVARAVANLDGSDKLKAKHIAEAVQYRADVTCFRQDQISAA